MIPTKVRRPWRGLGLTFVGRVLEELDLSLDLGDDSLVRENHLDHISVG